MVGQTIFCNSSINLCRRINALRFLIDFLLNDYDNCVHLTRKIRFQWFFSVPSSSATLTPQPTTATPSSSTKPTNMWDKAIDLTTPLGTFIIVIVAVALVLILLIALICVCVSKLHFRYIKRSYVTIFLVLHSIPKKSGKQK